jgi:excisionase family DNA binding protein
MTRWCRSSEAARMLGVSTRTVQRLAEAGVLPGWRFGHASWWRFDRRALERLTSDAELSRLSRLASPERQADTLGDSGYDPDA